MFVNFIDTCVAGISRGYIFAYYHWSLIASQSRKDDLLKPSQSIKTRKKSDVLLSAFLTWHKVIASWACQKIFRGKTPCWCQSSYSKTTEVSGICEHSPCRTLDYNRILRSQVSGKCLKKLSNKRFFFSQVVGNCCESVFGINISVNIFVRKIKHCLLRSGINYLIFRKVNAFHIHRVPMHC